MVDFGCGTGQWLSVFRECGMEVLGFDSDRVEKEMLAIPAECYKIADLTQSITLDKKYDLAVSIEVAEHLDAEYADTFIDTITNASDMVLFSAAIPHQGGTHHVNCQWQSYWAEKFAARGYVALDCIRECVWGVKDIPWYHKENTLMFCKNDAKYADILQKAKNNDMYDIVHPEHWEYKWRQMESLRRSKSVLLKDNEQKKNSIASLQKNISSLQKSVASLKKDIASLQSDIARLKGEKRKMERSVAVRLARRLGRHKIMHAVYVKTISALLRRK